MPIVPCHILLREKGLPMKIRFLPVVCFIVVSALSIPAARGMVTLGIKGGIGLSSFWGNDARDSAGMNTTMRSGGCAGALCAVNFNEYLAGQVELLYSMKGKSSIGDYPAYSKGITVKADYLEAPLLLKFSYPVGDISRLFVNGGPVFSFLASSTKDSTLIRLPSQITIIDTTFDTRSRTNAYDVGAMFGGGMAVKGGPGEVIFEVRCTLGFLNKYKLTEGEKLAGMRQPDIKNSYFAFLLGYSITL
jgi:hypothetical protein